MDDRIANPFPQTGTPGSISIEPVGYDKKLNDIKTLVTNNVGYQPLIINICGEYGQGKTTVLKYLENKFKGQWANLVVKTEDISQFPDFLSLINSLNDVATEDKKDGIFLILDEMQHVIVEEEGEGLTDNQKTFLGLLRNFADNNMGVDVSNVILCLAMHPQTKLFFDKNGYSDVEQRKNNFFLNLRDLDYSSAHLIVDKHFDKMNKKYDDFFDESFINAFFILLQHIEIKRRNLKTLNGRTFIQLFFNLFEFWRNKSQRLSQEDLKEILLGKNDLILDNVSINLANVNEYHEISEGISPLEKDTWNEFVFNPKWHLLDDLLNLKNIKSKNVTNLTERGYLSKRNALILSPEEASDLDVKLIDELKYLKSEKIFLNGEKIIYFVDELNNKILENIENNTKYVYRLKEDYLKLFYGYDPAESLSDELIEYYHLEPSEKVNLFYEQIDDYISREIFDNIKKKNREIGQRYSYLEILHHLIGKIDHKIAIFFYTDGYGEKFSSYLNDIINEIEDSNFEMGIIFLCPYFNDKIPQEPHEIRHMNNRLFIVNLEKDEFTHFLRGNTSPIEKSVSETIRIYTQEAVKKGFILPLTGFKEKIGNSYVDFRDIFIQDVTNSWKIEMERRSGQNITEFESPIIMEDGVDGRGASTLNNLARDSLSEFIDLDNNGAIRGLKFSKYEMNFWSLFGSDEEYKDEIKNAKNRIFSSYSRFDVEIFVKTILEAKFLLKEIDDKYVRIKPSDYISPIFIVLNNINLKELSQKHDLVFKELISKLKLLISEMKWEDMSDRSFYNYQLDSVLNKLKKYEKEDDKSLEIISDKYLELVENLNKSFFGVQVSEVDVSDYIKEIDAPININSKFIDANQIKKYVSDIIKVFSSSTIDSDLLEDLRSVIEKSEAIGFRDDLLTNLSISLDKIEKDNQIKDLKIITGRLLEGDYDNFYSSEYEAIIQFLNELDQKVITPVSRNLNSYFRQFENITAVNNNIKAYDSVLTELKTFERHDTYINHIKGIKPIFIFNEEDELINIQNLLRGQLNLTAAYLNFLEDRCGKNELKLIKNAEKTIKNKTGKELFDYLNYVSKLHSVDYIKNNLNIEFGKKKRIDEENLISTIDSLKKIEYSLKYRNSNEIIDHILHEGFLKRLIFKEEYYDNGKKSGKTIISYQIREK